MASILDTPPDSVRKLADIDETAAANAAGPPTAPIVSLAADIDLDGRYGSRWLVVNGLSIRVYSLDATDGATLDVETAIEDVKSAHAALRVGSGALVLETHSGALIEAVRYTPAKSHLFSVAARIITALATGEPHERFMEADDRRKTCAKCGGILPQDSSICPTCTEHRATLTRLFKYAAPYMERVAMIVVMSFVGTAIGLLSPYLTTKVLTDQVLRPHRHENWIGWLVAGSLGLALASVGTVIWRGRLSAWVSNHMVYRLRTEIYDKLQDLSVSYFDQRQVGSLATRVTQDVNELQNFLVEGVQQFFVNFLTIIGIVIVMASFNVVLTIIAVVPLPLTVYATRRVWKRLQARMHRMYYLRSSMGGMVNSALSGIRVVKAFNQEVHEKERFGAKASNLFDAQLSVEQAGATIFPLMGLLASSGMFLIYYFGGIEVFQGVKVGGTVMTLGTLLLFLVYVVQLNAPLQQISRLAEWYARSTAAAERVFEVIDATVDIDSKADAVRLPEVSGAVELRNVHFSYDKTADVLQDVSLAVAPGEMIGLVGHSGAGKSTLINLLSRFYNVTEGAILIDGHDIRDINLHDLRSQVGVVLQESFLFPGTVRDNIAYARQNATFEAVMRAAKRANAHDFIIRLPDGYDTFVGERGARLSGGERQRISIARAILHNPRILILDEATASVDTETEKQIQDAISYLVKGRTTFAIAHRLSTLRNANRLVVLERGKIVEVGTHEELLSKEGGVYRHLVDMQQAVNKLRDEAVMIEG